MEQIKEVMDKRGKLTTIGSNNKNLKKGGAL